MKIRKIYKKGVDEYKNAWYYMEAVTERGTLPEISKKINSKKLATGNFFTRYGEKVLDKMKST